MEDRHDHARMAAMASQRARIYDLLVMVFGTVPSVETIGRLRGEEFRGIVQAFLKAGSKTLNAGAALVDAYISKIDNRDEGRMIEELSIDRTLLVRAPGENEFKAPYEGLYKKKKSDGGAPLAVKTFYRRAGMLPDDAIHEPPDFLCLELDFMRSLCRREADEWAADKIPAETIRLEHEFLREHLGAWIEEYCHQAAERARTDFYRGCLGLMKATVAGDREILRELVETVKLQ